MPIYEYTCAACGREFEELVRGDAKPPCPACASPDVRKKLSAFGVSTAAPTRASSAPGPCGQCGDPRGPGACAMG